MFSLPSNARHAAEQPSAYPPIGPSAFQWSLLLDAAGRPGAENMALDRALLEEADRTGRAFLRLYRWDPPCLSFGRNEPATKRYDRAAIERLGLDVVRRPTGGRAVWHEHEVTYAVAAPIAGLGSLRAAYRAIHERLAAALRTLGADAALARDRPSARPLVRPSLAGACFATPVGGEVMLGDRKVVGSAQVRLGSALLQHGSILLDGSQDIVRQVRRGSGNEKRETGDGSGETTLAAALGRPVSFEEVAEAVVRSWGDPFPVSRFPLPEAGPSPSPFADPDWTWRR